MLVLHCCWAKQHTPSLLKYRCVYSDHKAVFDGKLSHKWLYLEGYGDKGDAEQEVDDCKHAIGRSKALG